MSIAYRILFTLARAVAIGAPRNAARAPNAEEAHHAHPLHGHHGPRDALQGLGRPGQRPAALRRPWRSKRPARRAPG